MTMVESSQQEKENQPTRIFLDEAVGLLFCVL
jgi:hypothetical protein